MSRSAAGKMMRGRMAVVLLAGAAAIVAALLILAAGVSLDTPTAQAQSTKDSWQLNTDNGPSGSFTNAVGLSQGLFEVIEHKIVDENGNEVIVKIPGKRTVSNIVLSKSLTSDQSFADWHQQVVDGQVNQVRTHGSIVHIDATTGEPVATFEFTAGWPGDYRVKTSDGADGALVEEVELVVEDLNRVQ
jgi:phage tail-like protein